MSKRAVICGAGIVGLTLANHLIKQGWQVSVFEGPDAPYGGSLNAVGVISTRNRPIVSPLRALLHEGFQQWPRFHMDELELAPLYRRSIIEVVTKEFVDGHELLREGLGRAIPLDDVQALVGEWLDIKRAFVECLWIDAYFLNVFSIMKQFKKNCEKQGAVFYPCKEPVRLCPHASHSQRVIVDSAGEQIEADLIIWATGAWAHQHVDPQLALPCKYRMEKSIFQVATKHEVDASFPIFLAHSGLCGQIADGSFCIGSKDPVWHVTPNLQKKLKEVVQRVGYRGRVSQGYPIFGLDRRYENLFWAYAFHRVGMTVAPALPLLLDHALHQEALPDSFVQFDTASAIHPDRFLNKQKQQQ